jgi:hypothetical protein
MKNYKNYKQIFQIFEGILTYFDFLELHFKWFWTKIISYFKL